MRNQQFQSIVKKIRLETSRSTNTALGQNEEEALKNLANRYYEWLYFDHTWSFLKTWAPLELVAGEYKYDVPNLIDPDRIERFDIKYGADTYVPVERGITPEMYNSFDSEQDERLDPIQRWDIRFEEDQDSDMLIVWPAPATDGTAKISGRRAFAPMVSNSDLCLIDDQIVILFAAAELLEAAENPRFKTVRQAGTQRYRKLKYRTDKNTNSKFSMAGQDPTSDSCKKSPEQDIRVVKSQYGV